MSILSLGKTAGEPEDLYSKAPQGGINHLLFMARAGDSPGEVPGPAKPRMGGSINCYGGVGGEVKYLRADPGTAAAVTCSQKHRRAPKALNKTF